MSRISLPVRTAISSVAPVALALVVLFTGPASEAAAAPRRSADTVDELRSKARDIAGRLDELGAQSSRLDEDYNAASLEFEDLSRQVAENQAAVDAARDALSAHRKAAQDYAIDAYTGSSASEVALSSLVGGSSADASQRTTYLTVLHGDRSQVIEDVTAAEAELTRHESDLQRAAAEVDAKRAALARLKSDLERNVAESEDLLAQTKGELAQAVAAEEARIAAQQAARAEAEARASASRLAAARQAESARRAAASVRTTASGAVVPATPRVVVGPPAPQPEATAATGSGGGGGTGTAQGAAAIAAARTQLGVPYRWGASSPGSGFDCSGLVMYAYAQAGRSLPHSSRALYGMTRRIGADELQPGDLVFGGSPVHHVGIYVGGGMMIHAPQSGDVVKIASMYSTSRPVSFGRL